LAFEITITDVAQSQLRSLSIRDRRILEAAINSRFERTTNDHEQVHQTTALECVRDV
jgi:hypothetical protein